MEKTKKTSILKDQRFLLIIVIAIIVVIATIINPKFLTGNNIMAILQQISIKGVMTMAMAILMISGGIDLSIGNMMALSAVVMAVMIKSEQPLWLAILLSMSVSVFCGLLNGVIIAFSHCVPLIVTLGTSQIFYGIALLVTGGSFMQFNGLFDWMRKVTILSTENWQGIPMMVIIMLAIVILTNLMITRTQFGRRLVAMGGNETAAYLSGIKVTKYKTLTYVISGFLVSISGMIFAARMNAIAPANGSGYELDALVACVVGGITFEGGRGTISGALLGCLLVGVISNALDILGVDAYVKITVTGVIIVLAVVLSNIDKIRKKA